MACDIIVPSDSVGGGWGGIVMEDWGIFSLPSVELMSDSQGGEEIS